jgi:hypothetical protein
MPSSVRVTISDELLISALNTPGGAVYEWRDDTGDWITDYARRTAPVNNPLDAVHRDGVVGTYRDSFYFSRYGNGHRLGARIGNIADHAIYVEEGRSASTQFQQFSWTKWGGDIRSVGRGGWAGRGTAARGGRHILRNAVNARAANTGDYGPIFGV